MAGRIPLAPAVVFTGGVALNAGVAHAIEQETGVKLLIPPEPQTTGALGAALLAAEKARAAPGTT
jgi:activator of 2-hydroxyglutaryl-CoA dehydratase